VDQEGVSLQQPSYQSGLATPTEAIHGQEAEGKAPPSGGQAARALEQQRVELHQMGMLGHQFRRIQSALQTRHKDKSVSFSLNNHFFLLFLFRKERMEKILTLMRWRRSCSSGVMRWPYISVRNEGSLTMATYMGSS
jgi:hypothetical protein